MPAKPYREPQNKGLHHADQGQVLEQAVAELGHGEDIDEVEQQLLERHPRMVAITVAK
ncbi:hypothetical protein D3C84_1282700 [compost metagenome]